MKQKYVRLIKCDSIIVFPTLIQHSKFANLDIMSAGFCYIDNNEVKCFGESVSLKLTSKDSDRAILQHQLFGKEY